MLLNIKGKGYKTRLLNPIDELYDRLLHVKTFGLAQYNSNVDHPHWTCDYVPTPYRHLFLLLRLANIDHNTVLIDFGCGLGRALFAAHHLGAKQCIGVEFDSELCKAAENNILRSRTPSKIEVHCLDAAQFMIPKEANLLFFFNPFGIGTMRSVVSNIITSLNRNPRSIQIIYLNPIKREAFSESPFFKLETTLPEVPGKRYAADFWTASKD